MKIHSSRDPAEELQEMVEIAVREHGPQARSVRMLAKALDDVRGAASSTGGREARSSPRERRERPAPERSRRG